MYRSSFSSGRISPREQMSPARRAMDMRTWWRSEGAAGPVRETARTRACSTSLPERRSRTIESAFSGCSSCCERKKKQARSEDKSQTDRAASQSGRVDGRGKETTDLVAHHHSIPHLQPLVNLHRTPQHPHRPQSLRQLLLHIPPTRHHQTPEVPQPLLRRRDPLLSPILIQRDLID